jgi:hypothetical protein
MMEEIEYSLGSNIFLTAKLYNGSKVVHLRKYAERNGKRYPTKHGVCFTPMRFAALVMLLNDIDEAYKFVQETEDDWRTIHIGGALFGSVTHGYNCVNIRYFFRSESGKVLPTKQGIALPIAVWEQLKTHAVELKEKDPELKEAVRCNYGDLLHQNQMEAFNCGECSPFYDPFLPPFLPPEYSAFLQCIPTQSKPKKRKTTKD